MKPSTLGWGQDDRAYPARFVVNRRDGAEMAWIPAGEFTMGSIEEEGAWVEEPTKKGDGIHRKRVASPFERPTHRVRITRGLWMYRHEVTNAQYRRSGKRLASGGHPGTASDTEGDLQPAVLVNWFMCADYCRWAGVGLPTEAEWEYACRAGTTTRFWWGDGETEAGRYANVGDRKAKLQWAIPDAFDTDDGYADTAPVGSYAANQFGLFDMIGNAAEWCGDWYGDRYYDHSPYEDPRGPADGMLKVYRGGCNEDGPLYSRCAHREARHPDKVGLPIGFRAVVHPR